MCVVWCEVHGPCTCAHHRAAHVAPRHVTQRHVVLQVQDSALPCVLMMVILNAAAVHAELC